MIRNAIKICNFFSDSPFPIGTIRVVSNQWSETVDWVEADGRLLPKSKYPELYEILMGPDGRCMYGEIGFGNKFRIPNLKESDDIPYSF